MLRKGPLGPFLVLFLNWTHCSGPLVSIPRDFDLNVPIFIFYLNWTHCSGPSVSIPRDLDLNVPILLILI